MSIKLMDISDRIKTQMHYIQFTYGMLLVYFIVNAIEYSKDHGTFEENKTLFILNLLLVIITLFALFSTSSTQSKTQ
tara:strand:+ start:712 stop:942 length:231 start_codon:yes stop_codon:yes gene_type:complete